MKILILGSQGSLGQTFADIYQDQQVSAWDRPELDIIDEKSVMEKITSLRPDLIINCAAYNAVDKAEEQSKIADSINGYAVGFIARAAKIVGATMVHYSSAYVFDGNSPEGYNEDGQPNPLSAYARSKLLGETELMKNCEKFYLIRTTWLYGRESMTGKSSFVDLMHALAKQGKEIKAIADEFGQPTYVLDLAQATRALIAAQTELGRASTSVAGRETTKPFGIYHLTNSGSCSWYEWAKEIFSLNKVKANLMEAKSSDFARAAKRPKFGILNNTKFITLRPWQEALKEYLS